MSVKAVPSAFLRERIIVALESSKVLGGAAPDDFLNNFLVSGKKGGKEQRFRIVKKCLIKVGRFYIFGSPDIPHQKKGVLVMVVL